MADQSLDELTAVVTPAGTDELYTVQGGVDKRISVTQINSLGGVSDPLLLSDGTAGAPTYSYSGDPLTGFFYSLSNTIGVSSGGTEQFQFGFTIFQAAVPTGGAILNESSSSVNPTVCPARNDLNTGIGSFGADSVSLIGGGVEIARASEGTNDQFLVIDGSAAGPGYSFISDPDTGFFLSNPATIDIATAGTSHFEFASTAFGGKVAGGPRILDELSTDSNPTLIPHKAATDIGIGGDGANTLSLIISGIDGLKFADFTGSIIQIPDAAPSVTATAGGGQGSATTLVTSYNVIDSVVSTGDSVKLPGTFFSGSILFVKNDGANSMDIFPATGDDLGQGTNTAEALAAGVGVAYIATAASSTWTRLF